jgi:3-deoxy-D-manno-octulosonic acid kinase
VAVEVGGAQGFARRSAAAWLEETLRAHGTLRAWAESAGSPLAGGRVAAHVVPARAGDPEGSAQWVCRAYHRGGLAAPLLGDRYLDVGERRPLAELRAAVEARARGMRTPAVVAGAAYPSGRFYRADIVSERVPATRSLADALFAAGAVPAAQILHAAGRLVASLERARVAHRDLNAANILVPIEPFAPDCWVVDLDGCRTLPLEAPPPIGAMRRRLERSLAKLSRRRGRPWTDAMWEPLRAGYEDRP